MKTIIDFLVVPAGLAALITAILFILAYLFNHPIGVEFWKVLLGTFLIIALISILVRVIRS